MRPTFQKETEFTRELKEKVRTLLAKDPGGRLASSREWLKALILMMLCLCLYGLILFLDLHFLQRTALVLLFAAATLILGLNVMHEAAHGNYSSHSWINRLLALTFDLYGISSDLYQIKHNQFHHNYTNIYGLDGDITEAPLIRMTQSQPWMRFHRYQFWYTPFLYSLITITWPIFDLSRLITAKVGNHSFKRPGIATVAKICIFKILSFFLTYVLPVKLFGVFQGLFFILLFHFSLGLILTLIFQAAHVHEECHFPGQEIQTDWFVHQIQTSADFSTSQPWVNFLFGGLNFQTIHHLFPNVSYRHYPEIRKILVELCAKHGISYHEFPTFTDAVRFHFKWLRELSTDTP